MARLCDDGCVSPASISGYILGRANFCHSTLSMTHGRPTMTTHLAPLPPPDDSEMSRQDPPGEPSLLSFYIEAIKLYSILDKILSDVYCAWCSRTRQDRPQASTKILGGLDTILEIERELTLFEASTPPCLKWDPDAPEFNSDGKLNQAIAQQRNVLHARCVSSQSGCYLGGYPSPTYADTCIFTSSSTVRCLLSSTQKKYAKATL